jgi:hypothetical protein
MSKKLVTVDFVGFEVLIVMVMKSSILWDVTPCSPFKVNQCFGGTFSWLKNKLSTKPARKQVASRP